MTFNRLVILCVVASRLLVAQTPPATPPSNTGPITNQTAPEVISRTLQLWNPLRPSCPA